MTATQLDVAARAGVSRALVSLVMRGSDKVAPASREAVLRAAEQLGYRPNAFAARLASRSTRTLGVVLVQLHNPVFPETMRGIEVAAEGADYGMLLKAGVQMDAAAERRAVDDHLSHQVDGLILVATRLPASELRELSRRVPIVTVFRRVEGVDSVQTDERQAALSVVEHLIGLGHRRIAHICAGGNPGSRIRRNAYSSAMAAHHLEQDILVVEGDYTEGGGHDAATQLLDRDRPPTAIFAANDLTAVGAMGAARERGIKVPAGLSIAGIDNTTLSGYSYISLTTAGQPLERMGREAVRVLTDRIAEREVGPTHVQLRPELVVRSSTAPPA